MSWPDYKPVFSAFDLLEAGACFDGVTDAVKARGMLVAPTASHALNEWVAKATHSNGYGDGYGYGDGDGYGYGYGDGDGYGYGDGDGNGYGQ